ncbi:MAG: rhomboid family intramembrane serine protease [Jiangellaceae bacterium]|nr:rhomboid family intramembrane serine protease [Jiangellaceae bacterium]
MTGFPGGDERPPAGAAQPSAPVCYRHPDRETYIRCARCERYICPDCMITAPVGFQCPECVREGAASVRQPTTLLGGQVRAQGDVVTKTLVGLNVAVFVLGLIVGFDDLIERLALFRGVALIDGEPAGVLDGELYRMLTAAFLHEQWWHIGMNMYALWVLGSLLEPVLGRWRFAALYLLSAVGGSTASLLASGVVSLGASGGVFGLLGALFVVMRRFGRDVSAVLVILGINLVLTFVVRNIDWRAHLGGLVTGAVLAYAFAHAPRARRTAYSLAACVVVLGVIAAVLAWLVV